LFRLFYPGYGKGKKASSEFGMFSSVFKGLHGAGTGCALVAISMIALTGTTTCGYSENILTSNNGNGGDIETDTGSSLEIDIGTNVETDSETVAQSDSESDTGTGAEDDSDSGSETDTDSDSDIHTETDTELDSDTDTCRPGGVEADEVVLIGDSWMWRPAPYLRDLAREAGAIRPDEDYIVLAKDGNDIEAIVAQYNSRQEGETKVRVLIMDGGGIDTIRGGGSQESIDHVVSTFEQHLDQMASDGTVQHVIYSLYPEGGITPAVADLRPGMQAACASSPVPCRFLDLQPLWEGHPEYNREQEQINPSDEGSRVIAESIWSIMEENCIAQ
jgi:hypothetical protein